MARFRKKPVVIEACRADAAPIDQPEWLRTAVDVGIVEFGVTYARIHTLEGVMTAEPTDWIIRGVKGELYPCKPDVFAATYEAVA